jgi:uncharacterized Zn finger protein
MKDLTTRQQLLGESWWTTEFLSLMNPSLFNDKELALGKKLAERGQVAVNSLSVGQISTIVLGSIGGNHRVSIWVMDLEEEWEIVFRILALNQPLYKKLLSGDYSQDLHEIFKASGIWIIPTTLNDLDYTCECEGSHICSHIFASYLSLGKYVNDDPMVLFQLRGKTRQEIISKVELYTQYEVNGTIPDDSLILPVEEEEEVQISPEGFYEARLNLNDIRFRINPPPDKEKKLINQLGPSPFKIGKIDLARYIIDFYPKAADYVKNVKSIGSGCQESDSHPDDEQSKDLNDIISRRETDISKPE